MSLWSADNKNINTIFHRMVLLQAGSHTEGTPDTSNAHALIATRSMYNMKS